MSPLQGTKEELAAMTVRRWQQGAESHTADMGRRMLAGEWIGRDEVEPGAATMLSQVVAKLRLAGFKVAERRTPGATDSRLKQWQVNPDLHAPVRVEREAAGLTHPELGAVLTVRALAMTDDGELAMTLSNGSQSWSAVITAHLAQGKRR